MAKKKMTLEEKLQESIVKDVPYEVPKNWVWTKWGTLGEFIAGVGFKPKYQGKIGLEIPFLKVGSLKYVDNQGFIIDEKNTISEEDRFELKAKLIPKNALIFAKVGEAIRLNRRALISKNSCIDNNTMSFISDINVNYKYIYYFSKTIDLYEISNSTTVPSVRKSDLEYIKIPLSPLKEQQRIVDKIESLFEKLDKAKELIEEARDNFEKRKSAILEKAFRGELTQIWRRKNNFSYTKTWSRKIFSEIAEVKSNLVKPQDFLKYPHIAPDNIEKKTGKLLEYRTIEEDNVKSAKHRFYPGQIIYSKIRPYLSKVILVDFEGLCSADMYPIETELDTKYLYYYMLSDTFVDCASNSGSRSVLPKINQKELGKIKVPVCNINEQKEIVRILDKLLEEESKIEELTELEEQIELIKKSILAKAFRGELGTNCEEDESALELLKEILNT